MSENITIFAAILGGGYSERMGYPKALLRIKGTLWAEHMWDIANQIPIIKERLLFMKGSHASLPLKKDIFQLSEPILEHGPLGGVHGALNYFLSEDSINKALILVLPVDMPLLDPQTLRNLVYLASQSPDYVHHFQNHLLPSVIPLTSQALHLANSQLSKDSARDWSLRKYYHNLGYQTWPCSHTSLLVNINSNEDWQAMFCKHDDHACSKV